MTLNFHLEEECYIHSQSNRLKQTLVLVTKQIYVNAGK